MKRKKRRKRKRIRKAKTKRVNREKQIYPSIPNRLKCPKMIQMVTKREQEPRKKTLPAILKLTTKNDRKFLTSMTISKLGTSY